MAVWLNRHHADKFRANLQRMRNHQHKTFLRILAKRNGLFLDMDGHLCHLGYLNSGNARGANWWYILCIINQPICNSIGHLQRNGKTVRGDGQHVDEFLPHIQFL